MRFLIPFLILLSPVKNGVCECNDWRYCYEATVTRIVDGDTIDLGINQGLNIRRQEKTRLGRINTWENRGIERPMGLKATASLDSLIGFKKIVIETDKDRRGKYGRYIIDVYLQVNDSVCINVNDWMIWKGHGVYQKY